MAINIVPDTLCIGSESDFNFCVPKGELESAIALAGQPTPPEVAVLEPTLANLILRGPQILSTHPKTGAIRVRFTHDINANSRVQNAKPRSPRQRAPGSKRPETRLEIEAERNRLKRELAELARVAPKSTPFEPPTPPEGTK